MPSIEHNRTILLSVFAINLDWSDTQVLICVKTSNIK